MKRLLLLLTPLLLPAAIALASGEALTIEESGRSRVFTNTQLVTGTALNDAGMGLPLNNLTAYSVTICLPGVETLDGGKLVAEYYDVKLARATPAPALDETITVSSGLTCEAFPERPNNVESGNIYYRTHLVAASYNDGGHNVRVQIRGQTRSTSR